jgi:hypothetical protein
MAEGTDEGVSYLRALKQSSGLHDGTAAAPALETSPEKHPGPEGTTANAGERFQGSEKRRSTRYKCDGSAGMREEGCDVHTWASFTDVSLHGCYVEAQATYPVGTILHLKLEANRVCVESKGTVRVSYPYLGMGIAFMEVSEETRERLKEMLGSVSRPTGIMGPGIASSLPARGPLLAAPLISDPAAALRALTEFFESRQMLMREDFLRILHKSQSTEQKP